MGGKVAEGAGEPELGSGGCPMPVAIVFLRKLCVGVLCREKGISFRPVPPASAGECFARVPVVLQACDCGLDRTPGRVVVELNRLNKAFNIQARAKKRGRLAPAP